MAEISTILSAASASKLPIKGIGFALKIAEAGEQAQSLCNLVEVVYHDYVEAQTLRESPPVRAYLLQNADQRLYIDRKLESTTVALNNIVGILEPYRVRFQTVGKVSLGQKISWVTLLEAKATYQEKQLSACHRSLLDAMQTMRNISGTTYGGQMIVIESTSPLLPGSKSPPPTYESSVDPQWLKMRRRQHSRKESGTKSPVTLERELSNDSLSSLPTPNPPTQALTEWLTVDVDTSDDLASAFEHQLT